MIFRLIFKKNSHTNLVQTSYYQESQTKKQLEQTHNNSVTHAFESMQNYKVQKTLQKYVRFFSEPYMACQHRNIFPQKSCSVHTHFILLFICKL